MQQTDEFKKNIHDDYDIEEELGSGQFAVVRKIVEKETGDEFAAKYVRKKRTKASRNGMSREDIKREIEILRMVDSEKIIKIHDIYETDKEIILVMELLRGGELFDYISKKDYLTEEEAIDFTRQILQGLQHLHSRNVVHLDLKPENILLKNTRRKTIKLVDFGLARVVNKNEQVREIMGTPEFVAPEVLNFDTISTATDMWALGVIAYILLSGASPFLGEDNQETFTNIIQVDYQFDEEYFSEISDEAKDFIKKLLVKNPRKRPSAHDCSRHPWVEDEVVDKKKKQRRRTTQICTFNFKRFVARKRWKMSYNKIRAMNLIAKLGIKPPPGFITEIPPMNEVESETVEPKVVEEKRHKEHKKNVSTIHRKKNKQCSTNKPTSEKNDSLSLKTMDIDIGEVENNATEEPEPELENEVKVDEEERASPDPVDYGCMSKREKRRARGQLLVNDIAKSKKEIDAKQSEVEPANHVVSVNNNRGSSVFDVDVTSEPVEEKPAEERKSSVTSTVHIERKPPAVTPSVGACKKTKASRIPSTEDHYFVTLNAALLQQEESIYTARIQSPRPRGILKQTTGTPTDVNKPTENKKVSDFTAVVQVTKNKDTGDKNDTTTTTSPETAAEKVAPGARETSLTTSRSSSPALKKFESATSPKKKFNPPPWQKKPSRESIKVTALQGVSNVSVKTNRFMTNGNQASRPHSPSTSNPGTIKTSNVLGKSKLFQNDGNKEENKKGAVGKINSNDTLNKVSCDIKNDGVSDISSCKENDLSETHAASPVNLDGETNAKPGDETKSKQSPVIESSSDSTPMKNGEIPEKSRRESFQSVLTLSPVNKAEVAEEKGNLTPDVKDELKCVSTNSLTEFTIRPRGNSGDNDKPGGFDVMLSVTSSADIESHESGPETRVASTRFTSSSSSLPNPRLGLLNGKLASLSTNDVTAAERHSVAAHGGTYTPQRDFSKYLNNNASKSFKTKEVSSLNQKPPWQTKRNNPSESTIIPMKTIATPTTKPTSVTAKNAPVKISIAMPKGKKPNIVSSGYVPTRSFGFATKGSSQSEVVPETTKSDDLAKLNNNDDSKRLSQSSYTSERSGSSGSDELSVSNITAENNALNRTVFLEAANKNENHTGHSRDSFGGKKKWKATLVLPEGTEKIPSTRDRDIRISSKNAPHKKNFVNVRSMWEGK